MFQQEFFNLRADGAPRFVQPAIDEQLFRCHLLPRENRSCRQAPKQSGLTRLSDVRSYEKPPYPAASVTAIIQNGPVLSLPLAGKS